MDYITTWLGTEKNGLGINNYLIQVKELLVKKN